jgi:two-component system, OmpR family, response regulator
MCAHHVLTGKGDAIDRVVGLELGADGYLAKPFELLELLARIRGVLRRSNVAETVAAAGARYLFEDWVFDVAHRRVLRRAWSPWPVTHRYNFSLEA